MSTTVSTKAKPATDSYPKITLYTNHGCPWAHRAHIAIMEVGLPYEEVIIDLTKPREQWYLDMNPRGQVPFLKYETPAVTTSLRESAIVAQFLADAHPSSLQHPQTSPTTAAQRARIALFVDVFFNKVNAGNFKMMLEKDVGKKEEMARQLVEGVQNEIEPFLEGAGPFFGGAEKLTMAEVQTASFVLRYWDFADDIIYPKSLPAALDKLPRFSKWALACRTHPSVTYIWNKEASVKGSHSMLERLRAA